MHHRLKDFASRYQELTLAYIQEELTWVEGEASSHKTPLLKTKILTQWDYCILDISHARSLFNKYMQTMDIYWKMKFLLAQTRLDHYENHIDILHSLEHLHRDLRDLDQGIEKIEQHLRIPLVA